MSKDTIAILSALVLILSGIVLSFLGFFTAPKGEISDSVLWYLSQTLIYAGSVLGIKSYVDYSLKKSDNDKKSH